MPVDVITAIEIDKPREVVAAYAADPNNAPAWYDNIVSVDWKTDPPLAEGTRVAFVATFLGKRLAYTYKVIAWTAGEVLVMRADDGPFPMETHYRWEAVGAGRTRMTLRNVGEPAGLSRLAAPVMSMAMRRANRKDLAKLKDILDRQTS